MQQITIQASSDQSTKLIDLNFATIEQEKLNDQSKEGNKDNNNKIMSLHNQMFRDQNKDVVVGYLNTYNKQNLIAELPYLLQQLEYKQIFNQKREQILVIFHQAGGPIIETEPITLIKKAKNKYKSDPIDQNQPKTYTISTNLDLQKVKQNYQNAVQSEAEPFKIKEDIADEEVNKLYFICLKECEAKGLNCILIQANKVNERLFTNPRIASRIFQIMIRWSKLEKEQTENNQVGLNQRKQLDIDK